MSNDFENVMATTGWGVCNYFVIGLCCMCTLVEAGASLVALIVTPLLACDLKLNGSQAAALNAANSFGMTVGAFLFGAICDAHGRKGSIPVTMVIVFCGSIALSFAEKNFLINLSLFVLGVGLAGNNVVLRVYLIEYLPVKRRGSCLAILDFFWILGYLAALGVSWSLVPSIMRIQDKKFRVNSWRVLAGLGGAPCLAIACMLSLLPPSPRYLLFKRRRGEALSVLQQIYAINTSKHAETYPAINLENCIEPVAHGDDGPTGYFKRLCELFENPYKYTTILGSIVSLFHFPGFLWFALWNTEILEQLHQNGHEEFAVNSTCIIDVEHMPLEFIRNCRQMNSDRFENLFLLSLSYLWAEIVLAFGIDTMSRSFFSIFSRIIGTILPLVLIFFSRYEVKTMVTIFTLMAFAISYTTTTTILLENYPTRLRGTSSGLTRLFPYLGASFAKFLFKMECLQSIIAVSALFVGAAVAGLPLRDFTRRTMQE